jgi:hypothetical protein
MKTANQAVIICEKDDVLFYLSREPQHYGVQWSRHLSEAVIYESLSSARSSVTFHCELRNANARAIDLWRAKKIESVLI